FGKRVCIVERAPKPGGAAVNTGTIPSKALRETALYFSGLRQRGLYGIDFRVKKNITVADFMYRERAVIESQWKLIDENLERHGVTRVQGAARFVDPHTIEVTRHGTEPRRITGEVFLIATGSQPQQPDSGSVDGSVIVDSDSLLTLEQIPSSMIVVGGGVVGCEYACIFAALGVRVTIVTTRSRLLAHLDPEVCDALRRQITARLGVTVHTEVEVSSISSDGGRATVILADGTQIFADCALYSAGRIGASANLGPSEIGVRTNSRGFILVDEHYQTAQRGIFAAGDVIGFPALASTAMEQARVAICHAFNLKYKQAVANVVPYGVYTIPEIATVGATEDELRSRGIEYEIGRARYRGNARGMIVGDTDGFVKLAFRPENQQLLGASIVGENAGELIHVAMAVLANEGSIDFFIQSVFSYPSLCGAYKYAAYDGLQALAQRYGKQPGLRSSGEERVISI